MVKKFFFVLSIFSLFLISSCADLNGGGYGKNNLTFEIGSKVSDSIVRTVTGNPDTTELTIECSLLRGEVPVKKESKKVQLSQLYKTCFSITNIPNGNNYFISLDIYYKDYLIYTALSELIILNENQEEAAVKLSLKQNNSKITYELNGGNFSEGQKVYKEYFINSNAIIPEPVKKMSMFEGWYTNSSFEGEPVTELGKAKFVGDVTLYAKWREFGVKFEPNVDKVDYQDVIKLSCNVPGSEIRYTIDGSQPTESSTLYVDGIVVNEAVVSELDDSIKINAIAVNNGDVSNVCSKTYTMNRYTVTYNKNGFGTEECPTFSNYRMNDTITLPNLSQGIMIFNGWKLGDKLYKPGDKVKVTGDLVFDASWQGVVEPVQFSLQQGQVDYKDKVTLSTGTTGATIYYTTDNSDPSASSTKYINPIEITDDVTIRAIALKDGFNPSSIKNVAYTVKTYNITFNVKGHGTAPNNISGKYRGYKLTQEDLAIDDTNLGFSFDSWKTASGATISEGHEITESLTLTAQWTDVAPSPVTDASASISSEYGNSGIKLDWTNPADPDLSKILIELEGDTFTHEYTTTLTPSTAVSCVIKDFPANKGNYKFKITAVDGNTDTTKNKSSVTYAEIKLPAFTNVPTIYNWDKGIGKTGYKLKITGSNFQTTEVTISGTIKNTSNSSSSTLDITVVDDSNLTVTFDIPASEDDYTVHLGGYGCDATKKFSVGKFSLGDVVMSDGMLVPSGEAVEYFKTKPAEQSAIAVIFRPETRNPEGSVTAPALGIAMDHSEQELMWAPQDTTGAKTAFSTSAVDGSGNWNVIKAADSTGANDAQNKYPAFYWANNYGTSFSAPYNTGWYMPSEQEMGEEEGGLRKVKDTLNPIITAINGKSIFTTFWTSHSTGADCASLQNLNGYGLPQWNKWKTAHVRCVRKF